MEAKDKVSHSECEFGAEAQTYEQRGPRSKAQASLRTAACLTVCQQRQQEVTMYHKLPFTKSLSLQKNLKTFC